MLKAALDGSGSAATQESFQAAVGLDSTNVPFGRARLWAV